ncbi:MAG TPA: hypothetical protein VIM98_09485 [Dyella sp.]|uniref:hypothetical protein n=1 Tax=Dyella sp. TaxID=1869338 RepID=UPI002F9377D6
MLTVQDENFDRVEKRRMLLLGIPTFLLVWYVSLRLSLLANVVFMLFSMVPYSYFYMVAYRLSGMADRPVGRWKFYLTVLATQLIVIAGLVLLGRHDTTAR